MTINGVAIVVLAVLFAFCIVRVADACSSRDKDHHAIIYAVLAIHTAMIMLNLD